MDKNEAKTTRDRILNGERLDEEIIAQVIETDPIGVLQGISDIKPATDELRIALLAVMTKYSHPTGLTAMIGTIDMILDVMRQKGGADSVKMFLLALNEIFKQNGITATFEVAEEIPDDSKDNSRNGL